MTFTESITTCLRNYANFKGRASRSEFWWFTLFLFIGVILSVILGFLLAAKVFSLVEPSLNLAMPRLTVALLMMLPLPIIFTLVIFLPYCAVGIRRIRDTGKSDVFIIYLCAISYVVITLKGSFLQSAFTLIWISLQIYWLYLLVLPSAPEKDTKDAQNETDSPVKVRRK